MGNKPSKTGSTKQESRVPEQQLQSLFGAFWNCNVSKWFAQSTSAYSGANTCQYSKSAKTSNLQKTGSETAITGRNGQHMHQGAEGQARSSKW